MSYETVKISFLNKNFCAIGFALLVHACATGQVVINEIGVAPSTDNGSGGEFIELFNRTACNVDLSCYTLVFSSTTASSLPSGWTIKIPSGYSIAPCGYFVIGGLSGAAGLISGTGYPTGGTPKPFTGTADLDIGTIAITANAIYIKQNLQAGNFTDAGGQLSLLDKNDMVVSSVSYRNGNNPASYPLNAYTNCQTSGNTKGVNNVPNPGNAMNNVNGSFGSGSNQGIYLNASGVYIATTSLTPGAANPSQITCTPAISITTISSNSPLCEGTALNLSITTTGGGNLIIYKWTGPNGFTSSIQNPFVNNISATAGGVYKVNVSDGGCSASATINVIINPKPLLLTIYHN
jgi:hypothetical protein